MTVHSGARRRPAYLDSREYFARSKRHRQTLIGSTPTRTWFIFIIVLIGFVAGCGGASYGPPPPSIAVTVTSSATTVLLGNQLQFTAMVTGSSNTTVSWSVNGISGGNAMVGTIDPTGLYTAPADLPNPPGITVTAASQADPTESGSATVSFAYPVPSFSNFSPTIVPVGAADTTVTFTGTGF